jgi:electron transfer flavoprotein beta subunit
MLIIALLKGVPARTTKVVSVGGVLRREEMEIVLNPHDLKAVEAADFVKRRVGGKTVALSMGPDIKLSPLMKPLYKAEVFGVDEAVILSDRKMAGADTLATSYAVSLGVIKVVERHTKPVEELIALIRSDSGPEILTSRAKALYSQNLLPNSVYSDLPSVRESIIQRFAAGTIAPDQAVKALEQVARDLSRFIIVAGIKTTDGETGSVGPQVAESLAEATGLDVPHLTYVDDFDIDPQTLVVDAERRIGRLVQRVELHCPAVLTIAPDYEPRNSDPTAQISVRANGFKGKISTPAKWVADELNADPARLGIAGSPTIVGPGVDIGNPPVQKIIGRSLVFTQRMEKFQLGAAVVGPFQRGDIASPVPEPLLSELREKGIVSLFTFDMFEEEVFAK